VKGRRFEIGVVVIRATQSKPIDLVCLRRGEATFVECKAEKSGLGMRRRQELLSLAEAAGAVPLLSVRRKRKLLLKDLQTGEIVQTEQIRSQS